MEKHTPPSWDEIDKLIKHVDEVCEEAERARSRARRIRNSAPFWPDRRREARDPDEPPHRHHR